MKRAEGFMRPDIIFDTFSEMMLFQQKMDINVKRIEFCGIETWNSGKRYAVFWILYETGYVDKVFVEVDD